MGSILMSRDYAHVTVQGVGARLMLSIGVLHWMNGKASLIELDDLVAEKDRTLPKVAEEAVHQ